MALFPLYIVEQAMFAVWLVCLIIADLWFMCFRPGAKDNNDLARYFYRLVLGVCLCNLAIIWDYRGFHGLLDPVISEWFLASQTNMIFTGMCIYLFLTLRTLYQTAGKKIGGLAEDDVNRMKRFKVLLTIYCVLMYMAAYTRCVLLVLTRDGHYYCYFLWYLCFSIISVATVFLLIARDLDAALSEHGETFNLAPQLKRLRIIIKVIFFTTLGVVLAVTATATYIYIVDQRIDFPDPSKYDVVGALFFGLTYTMATIGILAPYRAPDPRSRARTVSTINFNNRRVSRLPTQTRAGKTTTHGGTMSVTSAEEDEVSQFQRPLEREESRIVVDDPQSARGQSEPPSMPTSTELITSSSSMPPPLQTIHSESDKEVVSAENGDAESPSSRQGMV